MTKKLIENMNNKNKIEENENCAIEFFFCCVNIWWNDKHKVNSESNQNTQSELMTKRKLFICANEK